MKVLILTVSTGQGHNQSAKAIAEYLEEKNAECRVLDAYKYTNQFLGESLEKGYLVSTQYASGMYGRFYRMAEKNENAKHSGHLSRITNGVIGQKLLRYILEFAPDVIITTHLFAALHLTYMQADIPDIKTFGIVTDFTMHPYWENTNLDFYVTASHLLNYQCARKGIPEYKVLPFGIPIQQKFAVSLPAKEARDRLGIADKTTILIMMGSMGYGNIRKIIRKVDKVEADFQILCVCGNNTRAFRDALRMETAHKLFPFGYVDNVDVMMDAADFMITKPGGLTLSEALAKAVPVILADPIPGQEDRNREFLVNNGVAMAVSRTLPLDEAVYQFLHNTWRRTHLREAIRHISVQDPTKKLGDYIIENYGK